MQGANEGEENEDTDHIVYELDSISQEDGEVSMWAVRKSIPTSAPALGLFMSRKSTSLQASSTDSSSSFLNIADSSLAVGNQSDALALVQDLLSATDTNKANKTVGTSQPLSLAKDSETNELSDPRNSRPMEFSLKRKRDSGPSSPQQAQQEPRQLL